jgi:bacillithiol biosynthesis cysteine-adding enzyme BshC
MIENRTLSFKHIPRVPPLFLDYLYNFSRLASFFPPFLPQQFDGSLAAKRIPIKPHREEVVAILAEQNRSFGAGSKTFENLQRLKAEGCAAVVTGQQVGLFTGPAYTVMKALTAVKLADEYSRMGLESVPVFWLASDDHDLAEVDHCLLVNSEGGLQEIRYTASPRGGSVGAIPFTEAISDTVAEFAAALPDTEFKQSLCGCLAQAYRPGNTFAGAFGEVLAWLFSEFGLIVMDPQEPKLKALVRPLFQRVVSEFETLQTALAGRNRQLEMAGYPLQVTADGNGLPLFMDFEGQRRGLVRQGQGIAVKGGGPQFSSEELLDKINETPDLFSPNVLLRPLCQPGRRFVPVVGTAVAGDFSACQLHSG